MKWFIIAHIAMYSMDALALLIVLCGSAFTGKPINLRAPIPLVWIAQRLLAIGLLVCGIIVLVSQ